MNDTDSVLQFFEMCSSPVNLGAARATPEFLVIDLGQWLELRNYVRLGHPL